MISKVKGALLTVSQNVGHYEALKKVCPYIVYAEDGAIGLRVDNQTQAQATTGTVDLFTKTESDPLKDRMQTALNGAGISWYLNTVQYEPDTGIIHYEWVWSCA